MCEAMISNYIYLDVSVIIHFNIIIILSFQKQLIYHNSIEMQHTYSIIICVCYELNKNLFNPKIILSYSERSRSQFKQN